MQYIWEKRDIRGGRKVKNKTDQEFMIGFSHEATGHFWFLIDTEGFVGEKFNIDTLPDELNRLKLMPVNFFD